MGGLVRWLTAMSLLLLFLPRRFYSGVVVGGNGVIPPPTTPAERASKSPQCLRRRLCLFIWRRLEKRQRSPVRQTSVRPTSVRVSARVIFARQPSRDVRVCTGMPVVSPLCRRNSLPKSVDHGRTRDRPERVSCPPIWIVRARTCVTPCSWPACWKTDAITNPTLLLTETYRGVRTRDTCVSVKKVTKRGALEYLILTTSRAVSLVFSRRREPNGDAESIDDVLGTAAQRDD